MITRRSFVQTGAGAALAAGMACAKRVEPPAPAPANPTKTGFLFDERYVRHLLAKAHPESPERLKAITRRMKESGLAKEVVPIEPSGDTASEIKTIHSTEHIELVDAQAHDPSICRLAVAGCLRAVDAVCLGKARNVFCAIRPPGHHAVNTGEYGFCFFGNVAIAARYAQQKHKIGKVLIVDWDYHHGNGTEWAFYNDPSVLFFSTHRLRAFPLTGFPERTGEGEGKGYNINVPLPGGADDKAILDAFEKQLLPAAERFKPGLVMISAGFDSRKDDLLGDFAVTDDGFAKLTRLMMSIARDHAKSRLVSALEGGYNTEGQALAVEAHVKALME